MDKINELETTWPSPSHVLTGRNFDPAKSEDFNTIVSQWHSVQIFINDC